MKGYTQKALAVAFCKKSTRSACWLSTPPVLGTGGELKSRRSRHFWKFSIAMPAGVRPGETFCFLLAGGFSPFLLSGGMPPSPSPCLRKGPPPGRRIGKTEEGWWEGYSRAWNDAPFTRREHGYSKAKRQEWCNGYGRTRSDTCTSTMTTTAEKNNQPLVFLGVHQK